MTTDVAGVLRNTVLLRSVPAPDLERVLAVSRLRTFRRGQVVCTRGDPGDTLIVVVIAESSGPALPVTTPQCDPLAHRRSGLLA